ncbi:MAG: AAA family ATPase, partial [Saprospiraceae bacterium]|nr:AAA family ATPase [Saprospiraceae bacterium]
MINELKITNFRLFERLEIKDLKRVNLFSGKNNSGKTALLEALRIMAAGEDLSVMRYILQQRGELLNQFWSDYDSFFFRPIFEQRKNEKDNPIE